LASEENAMGEGLRERRKKGEEKEKKK